MIVIIASAWASPIQAAGCDDSQAVPGDVVIRFTNAPADLTIPFSGAKWRAVNALFDKYHVRTISPIDSGSEPRTFLMNIRPDGKACDAIADFSDLHIVKYAEPNYRVRLAYTPNDPMLNQQWNFEKIGMSAAWDYDTTSPKYGGDPDVVIAVVDTGVAFESYTDPNHAHCFVGGDEDGVCIQPGAEYDQASDFSETRFTSGYDFVNGDAHPNDDNGHGTHVAGTIAQSTNNGIGAAGIAFQSTIMPIKVIARDGLGTTSMIAQGIDYATAQGADVINMSLGSSSDSQVMADAVADAQAAGIVVVAATGNSGLDSIFYPARCDGVIGVGATTNTEENSITPYSNYGTGIDIVAPGGYGSSLIIQQSFSNLDDDDLPADFTTFGFVGYQGTSMASPHVAAAMGLLLAAGLTGDEAIDTIHDSATDLGDSGYDLSTGYGLLNVGEALDRVDKSAPETKLTKSPKSPNGLNGYYTVRPTITLSATDDRTGVDHIYYRWGSDPYSTYTKTIRPTNGTHRLKYYAVDKAGNTESVHDVSYKVDTHAPTVALEPALHAKTFFTRQAVIQGTVTDEISGVKDVRVNGVLATVHGDTYTASVNLIPGRTNIFIQARDRAGLIRTKTDYVKFDATLRLTAGPNSSADPKFRRFTKNGSLIGSTLAYSRSLQSGINLASGDVDGDGKSEIITVPANSGSPQVKVFSTSGRLKYSFKAFDSSYKTGLSVAACDTNQDGVDEIVVGAGAGLSPKVRVLSYRGVVKKQFYVFPKKELIGANLACADVNNDGTPEVVATAASVAAPKIRIYKTSGVFISQFFAFPAAQQMRLSIALGDVNNNGLAEIVTAPKSGAAPKIRIFKSTGSLVRQFSAYSSSFTGGVQLAIADTNLDGKVDIITGPGAGISPKLKIFSGQGSLRTQFNAFNNRFLGGISVGTYYVLNQ